jgi:hypothetical protein
MERTMTKIPLLFGSVLVLQVAALGMLYMKFRVTEDACTRLADTLSAIQVKLDVSSQAHRSTLAEFDARITKLDVSSQEYRSTLAEFDSQITRLADTLSATQAKPDVSSQKNRGPLTERGSRIQVDIRSAAGLIRSGKSDAPTAVRFLNQNKDRIYDIYWIDGNGSALKYESLPPGHEYVQETFITHAWAFVDDTTGTVLNRVYQASTAREETVVLSGSDFKIVVRTAPDAPSARSQTGSANGF